MTPGIPPANRAIAPGPLGQLAARVYAMVVRARNARFDAGRGVTRLDRPVLSVGNLSVGGTGKTPIVKHLVTTLIGAGCSPCIAMRGYSSRSGISDEAEEYRRDLPGVPVVVNPDRAAALRRFFATPPGKPVDCAILDDGFQHRRLARDLDIVLIDATRPPFGDRLLPAGWLREPVESLARAGAIVLTHTESVGIADARRAVESARAEAPRAIIAECRHEWAGLRGRDDSPADENTLYGRRVFGACAIGNPEPFLRRAAQAAGGTLIGRMVLRDHDPYSKSTLGKLFDAARAAAAEFIIVTGKDWSKLAAVPADAWPCPVVRPVLRLVFTVGEADLNDAIAAAIVKQEGASGRRGPVAQPS